MTLIAQQRSAALLEIIQQRIQQQPDGLLSFADYMQLALYHPELGYYCSPDFKLGRQGDFTTAPEVTPLFGRCVARQIAETMRRSTLDTVYELGAGSGKLAFDVLSELADLQQLPRHYYIYEISETLRSKQQGFLQTQCPQWMDRIHWLSELPASFEAIVIANEVLDALPVHCFEVEENDISERCVGIEEGALVWSNSKTKTPLLIQSATVLADEFSFMPGYQSEINLNLNHFLASICDKLTRGVILFLDYGYGRAEYYHPERARGTLTCFYQHHRHSHPLQLPGLQDITAHVDFTRVIEIADQHQCQLAGFTTQASFLFACGLMNMAKELEEHSDEVAQFELHQAIKTLSLPTEMGERIKVMGLTKNLNIEFTGFSLLDRCREL